MDVGDRGYLTKMDLWNNIGQPWSGPSCGIAPTDSKLQEIKGLNWIIHTFLHQGQQQDQQVNPCTEPRFTGFLPPRTPSEGPAFRRFIQFQWSVVFGTAAAHGGWWLKGLLWKITGFSSCLSSCLSSISLGHNFHSYVKTCRGSIICGSAL